MRRHVVLPARGVLMVSTDVHGNLADVERLRAIFDAEREAHWVILGDVVHGPDAVARASHPEWYGYADESMAVVDAILAAVAAAPGRVHFVLGNHDHGHVGGPHPAKFYADEVAELEEGSSAAQRERLRGLFSRALLAAAAPCGVLMTHGAPDASFERLEDRDDAPLEIADMTAAQARMLRALLTSYGQPPEVCDAMLKQVSRSSGLDLRVVVHGHDRDEAGFFREGGNQVCPVIFGAARVAKRYVRLDLGARYESADALRDGVEIVRLYG
jgi:predicted phosphodiesterase